jgi:hypothetical protein
MRTLALAAAVLIASGSAALAAPASVSVSLSPELQKLAVKSYGVKDVERLRDELRSDVERELGRTGAFEGARIELVLVDAKPNRPTFKQMTNTPGLSMQSFGIGGAKIEGQAIRADGTAIPLSYSWYETDIRNTWTSWVWTDAEYAFDRFARRLGQGQALARR